jgi:hypothetical protein
VEDFSLCMQSLVSQLAAHDITITDEEEVAKYLRVVPPKYTQIALSIETLIDMSTLTLEDVIGWLKAVDEHVEAATASAGSKLLLTEEEWAACMREKRSREGRRRRRSRRMAVTRRVLSTRTLVGAAGRQGHWARDCKNPQKEMKQEAHLAQVDDEEPTLLMATFMHYTTSSQSRRRGRMWRLRSRGR